MPWIASMLATAVAFVSVRYRSTLLRDAQRIRHGLPRHRERSWYLRRTGVVCACRRRIRPDDTFTVVAWLIAWSLLHSRWKNRQIESRQVFAVALVLVGLGILATFPPVWGLF